MGSAAADLGALLRMPVEYYNLVIHIINIAATTVFYVLFIEALYSSYFLQLLFLWHEKDFLMECRPASPRIHGKGRLSAEYG